MKNNFLKQMKHMIFAIVLFLVNLTFVSLVFADDTPPTIPVVTDDGQYSTLSSELHANFSSEDLETGIAGYRYCIGTAPLVGDVVDWRPLSSTVEFPLENVDVTHDGLQLREGQIYYFTARAVNGVGLWSGDGISNGITVDTQKPFGSIIIEDGQSYTNSVSVTLTLFAFDNVSGMGQGAQMKFSNNKVDWSQPEAYSEVKEWILTEGDGLKRVFVKFKDAAGNWSNIFSDTIILDTTPPEGSITINNGDEYAQELTATLTLDAQDQLSGLHQMKFSNDNNNWSESEQYSDAKDWILSEGEGEKTVYVQYSDNIGNWSQSYSDTIILVSTPPVITEVIDDGESTFDRNLLHASWSAQQGGAPIAEYQYAIGTTQGENGSDIVDWTTAGLDTEVTVSNLNLLVSHVYYFNVKAQDAAGLWSDVVSSDGITVLNQVPEIISLTPENNSTFTEEDVIEIEVQAEDPNGDELEYQYSVDGEVIQGWTPQATHSWQTQAGDVKLKVISVEVRDGYEAVVSAQRTVFGYRKPPSPE